MNSEAASARWCGSALGPDLSKWLVGMGSVKVSRGSFASNESVEVPVCSEVDSLLRC